MTFFINILHIPLNEFSVYLCDNNVNYNNNDDLCRNIIRVNSTIYLGVTFDKHLLVRWTLDINHLIKYV
jgi:hypothetical protein